VRSLQQLSFLFLCPVTVLGEDGTDRREILQYGWYISVLDRFSPVLEAVPVWESIPMQNFGPKFWLFDHEYLENGKSQRYTSIRATVSSRHHGAI